MSTYLLKSTTGVTADRVADARSPLALDEQRAAERPVADQLRIQTTALAAVSSGVLVTDRDGVILWANPAMTRLTGYEIEELIGSRTSLLKSGRHSAGFYRELWRTVLGGRTWQGELVNRRKDGSEYVEEMSITPCRDEVGALTWLVAVKQDVTERRRTEDDLRLELERRRQLEVIVNRSPAVVYRCRAEEGLPVEFVSRYIERFGYRPEDLTSGRISYASIVHPEDLERVLEEADEHGRAGRSDFEQEYRILTRSGQVVWVRDQTSVQRDPSGRITHFEGIVADITLRKQAEEAQIEANRRLAETLAELKRAQNGLIQQERLSALGTMASGIAHDFNNALATVLGYSELLLYRPEALAERERAERYLTLINSAARDAGRIVNRLREFYRPRDPRDLLVSFDPNREIRQALSLTEPRWKGQAEASGGRIEVVTELGDAPCVLGDAAELRDALTNLIFNAIDAMPDGGCLTLRSRAEGDEAVIEVGDTGAGMTEEVRRRCLEPFYSTKGEHGTGLGLAIVHGTMSRQGGSLEIDSAPGHGTSVRLRLPRDMGGRPAASSGAMTGLPVRPLKILVVDDEAQVREVLVAMLDQDGHRVEAAASGREALARFLAARYDVALVDRAMPEMSGDEVARAMKALLPQIPVVLLTGFGALMEAQGERPGGVDVVASKPFTRDSLRAALASVLPGSHVVAPVEAPGPGEPRAPQPRAPA